MHILFSNFLLEITNLIKFVHYFLLNNKSFLTTLTPCIYFLSYFYYSCILNFIYISVPKDIIECLHIQISLIFTTHLPAWSSEINVGINFILLLEEQLLVFPLIQGYCDQFSGFVYLKCYFFHPPPLLYLTVNILIISQKCNCIGISEELVIYLIRKDCLFFELVFAQ